MALNEAMHHPVLRLAEGLRQLRNKFSECVTSRYIGGTPHRRWAYNREGLQLAAIRFGMVRALCYELEERDAEREGHDAYSKLLGNCHLNSVRNKLNSLLAHTAMADFKADDFHKRWRERVEDANGLTLYQLVVLTELRCLIWLAHFGPMRLNHPRLAIMREILDRFASGGYYFTYQGQPCYLRRVWGEASDGVGRFHVCQNPLNDSRHGETLAVIGTAECDEREVWDSLFATCFHSDPREYIETNKVLSA